MKKISIVGERDQFDFNEVKESVVLLKNSKGNRYYWKSSKDLTKINGRYYRKESPLVVGSHEGDYIFKKDAVRVEEGVYVHKGSNFYTELNGKKYLSNNIVSVDGKKYHKTDKKIVQVSSRDASGSKNIWILKDEAVPLAEWFYGSGVFVRKGDIVKEINSYEDFLSATYVEAKPDKKINSEGGIFIRRDVRAYINGRDPKREILICPRNEKCERRLSGFTVFYSPKNPRNPFDLRNPNRVRTYASDEDYFQYHEESGEMISKSFSKEYQKMWEKYYETFVKGDTEALRKQFNESFKDRDERENTARIVKKDFKKFPGGRLVEGMNFHRNQKMTNDLAGTGGIGYTFGVELEYSAGEINAVHLKDRNAALAGDGSVGGNEIVSGVLHGTEGMAEAERLCKILSKNCLVDDRCGIHVHVGGKNNKYVTTPKWGTDFNITAIKLGTILEEELFKMLPISRNPYLKYCRGIKKYSDISKDKWREQLGSFVFGSPHRWEDRDSGAELGRWPQGRYKWLNLVNAATRGPIKTIELRIWSGTTDWRKLRGYILLSLAFVHFVDNRSERIWSKAGTNLTLMDIVREAYQDREIVEFLEHFIEKRKASFNRKKIYNK